MQGASLQDTLRTYESILPDVHVCMPFNIVPTSLHAVAAASAVGASAMTRMMGSVLLGRTWIQRSGQSRRRPSRRFTLASGQRFSMAAVSDGNRSCWTVYLSFTMQ